MSDSLVLYDDPDKQKYVETFIKYSRKEEKVKDLAEKHNVEKQTIYQWIDKGRKLYLEGNKNPENNKASILLEYEWLVESAKNHYRETRDLNALKMLQSILQDYRKLHGIDAAPKAAVNKDGETVDNKLILVIDDSRYREKEKSLNYNNPDLIEGEVKEV